MSDLRPLIPLPGRTVAGALLSDKELADRVSQALETFSGAARAPFEHRDAAAGWAAWQELQVRRADEARRC